MITGLKDRVAIVCAASQGIGLAVARAFAAEGAHLALCARNAEILETAAAGITGEFGVRTYTESVDLNNGAATERFVANANGFFGRIDVCIANAGGPPAKDFLLTTDEEWDRAFALNLRSAVTLARQSIPVMQKQQWGRFITVSSITVRQPQPQLVLSNAIRAGVLGLIRSLSNEFGKDGITVNNVGPAYTATDRLLELSGKLAASGMQTEAAIRQGWIDQIPAGRLGKPEEVADAVVWLASERAAFITGQTILVDGGMYKGL